MNELRIYDCSGTDPGAEQTYVHWDRVRKFMAMSGMSFSTLVRKTGIPESTLRKLFQGITKDPRISTVHTIFGVLKLDTNIAMGFAPARDYDAEAERENVPLTESLKQQLADVRAERDAQLVEMDRLRKLVLSKGEALSRMEGRATDVDALTRQCADQQQRLEYKAEKIHAQAEEIAHLRATVDASSANVRNLEKLAARNRRLANWALAFSAVMAVSFIALAVLYIWDISNLNMGPTSWMYPDKFK